MAFCHQTLWGELDYGSEEDFPPLRRAFILGNYWFCENDKREMFFRSRHGAWFLEDPIRSGIFIESDFFWKLEWHYGQFRGQAFEKSRTRNLISVGDISCEHCFEPWLQTHVEISSIESGKPMTRRTSCPEVVTGDELSSARTVWAVDLNTSFRDSVRTQGINYDKRYHTEKGETSSTIKYPEYFSSLESMDLVSKSNSQRRLSVLPEEELVESTSHEVVPESADNGPLFLTEMQPESVTLIAGSSENAPQSSLLPCDLDYKNLLNVEEQLNGENEMIVSQESQSSSDPRENDWSSPAWSCNDNTNQVRVLDDALPEVNSRFPPTSHKENTWITTDKTESETIFATLVNVHKEIYSYQNEWLQEFPWVAISKCTKLSSFFEFDMEPDAPPPPAKTTGYVRDLYKILAPGSRVLVSSPPGFGKSTLCSLLIQLWAKGSRFVPFELCLKFHLSQLNVSLSDMSHCIIQNCKTTISNSDITEEMLRETCHLESPKILLILDGLDELPDDDQIAVCSFLQNTIIFKYSSILLTSRFSCEEAVGNPKCFTQHITINRLTTDRLEYLVRKLEKGLGRKKKCKIPKLCKKTNYFSELSPMSVYFLCAFLISDCCDKRRTKSLFNLLRQTVYMTVRFRNKNTDTLNVHMLFLNLGKFFLNCLVKEQSTFEEDYLMSYFSEQLHPDCKQLLTSCQIIYEERAPNEAKKCFSVSSKLLMVFFATYYLRHVWQKNKNSNISFLSYILRLGNLRPENNVTGEVLYSFSYIVGILPGIMLSLGRQLSLTNATTETLQDQEWLEHSHTFDSINLLLQNSKRDLERFGYKEVTMKDDIYHQLREVFDFVLQPYELNFQTHTFQFYSNSFEHKQYLNVRVKCLNETEVALKAVFRTDSEIQMESLYFDIRPRFATHCLDFLNTALSYFFPFFDIRECQFKSVGELIFSISCCVLLNEIDKKVLISCTEFKSRYTIGQRSTVVIYPNPGTTNIACTLLFYVQQQLNVIPYDYTTFPKAKEDIIKIIDSNCNYSDDSLIAFNVSR